jgi:tape measure domain-containing protein
VFEVGAIFARMIVKDDLTGQMNRAARQSTAATATMQAGLKRVDRSVSGLSSSITAFGNQSQKTVGGLTERLKVFNNRLERTEIGSKNFRILTREIKQTQGALDRAKGSAGSLASAIGPLLIGGGAAIAFKSLATNVLSAGAELEQTRISFQTFMRDVDKGNKVLKQLNDFADRTPFTNRQVLGAGRTLLAFGLEANKLEKTLENLGNASAATGKNFQDLAAIYGKAMTAGRVQAEELNQFTDAGIPIIRELSEMLGKTSAEIRSMGSEGLLTADLLESAFQRMSAEGGVFEDLMLRQSQTMGGLWSTITGKVQNSMARLGETLGTVIIPVLRASIALWESLGETGQEIVIGLGLLATGALAAAAAFVAFKGPLIAVGVALKAAFLAAGGLNPIVIALTVAIAALAAAAIHLSKNWERFSGVFQPIVEEMERFSDAAEVATDQTARLQKVFGTADLDVFNRNLAAASDSMTAFGVSSAGALERFSLMERVIKTISSGIFLVISSFKIWGMRIEQLQAQWDIFGQRAGLHLDIIGKKLTDPLNWDKYNRQLEHGLLGISINTMEDFEEQINGALASQMSGYLKIWAAGIEEQEKIVNEGMVATNAVVSNGMDRAGKTIKEKTRGWVDPVVMEFRRLKDETLKNFAEMRGITSLSLEEMLDDIDFFVQKMQEKISSGMGGVGAGTGISSQVEALREELAALGTGPDLTALFQRAGKQAASTFWDSASVGGLQSQINFVQSATAIFEKLLSTVQDLMESSFQVAANNIQSTANQFSLFADIFTTQWNRQKERELEILEMIEDQKIEAVRRATFERIGIIDAEFAARKAALEAELAQQLQNIETERIARGEQVAEKAQTQAQEVVDRGIVDEDARSQGELAQKEHEDKLRNLQKESTDKTRIQEQINVDIVRKAEEDKAKAVADFNARKEAEGKRNAKVRALIEYGLELNAFRISQQRARAVAALNYAQGLGGAVATGLQFGPAALVVIPTLIGLATASFAASQAVIASTPPPLPPASLFAQDGGVLMGPRHSQGGVSVEAEGGEAFLSRGLTRDLSNFISAPQERPVFAAGAIQLNFYGIEGAEEIAEKVDEAIAARMEGRTF